jgi:hypothetical protein
MKHDLANLLYIPPAVWNMARGLGYLLAAQDETPNMWVELSLDNMAQLLANFLTERRNILKGLSDE